MTTITWGQLTADEQENMQYLGGYCENDLCTDEAYEQLTAKGLAFVSRDNGHYGLDYALTPEGRKVLAQKPVEKTVKLRVLAADGMHYEYMFTDGTWADDASEVSHE